MSGKWNVQPGLHELFGAHANKKGLVAFKEGKTLHLKLTHDTTISQIETATRKALPLWFHQIGITGLAKLIVIFGFGAFILFLFTVLGIFENAVYDVLTQVRKLAWPEEVSSQVTTLSVISLIIGSIVIGFLPRLVTEPNNQGIKGALARYFDHDEQNSKRLSKRLKAAKSFFAFQSKINRIVVWNAGLSIGGGKKYLLPALDKSGLDCEFRVHHDEVQLFLGRAKEILTTEERVIEKTESIDAAPGQNIDAVGVLYEAMGPRAAESLCYLLAFSTLRAEAPWTGGTGKGRLFDGEIVGAEALVMDQWDRGRQPESDDERASPISFFNFLTRAERDYGLLKRDAKQHLYTFNGDVSWSKISDQYEHRLKRLNSNLTLPTGTQLTAIDDPAALLMMMIEVPTGQWQQQAFADVVGRYFETCNERGYFPGFSRVSTLLDIETSTELEGLPSLPALVSLVDLPGLESLSKNLEATGKYAQAIQIAELTEPFKGHTGTIRLARLKERAGNAVQGIIEIDKVSPVVDNIVSRLFNTEVGMPSAGECRLLLDYYQQRAWIILNGGLNEPGASTVEAHAHLQRVDEMLERVTDFAPEAIDVWRQDNYWATYHEVTKDFQTSYDIHLHAMKIPGLPLRWRYASMINAGVVKRRHTVGYWLSDGSIDVQGIEAGLKRSYELAELGYRLKLEIDDIDEAPFGAHNAALSQMYRFQLKKRQGEVGQLGALLQQAMTLVDAAIGLLVKAEAERKLHMILSEGILIREWAAAENIRLPDTPMFDSNIARLDRGKISTADKGILGILGDLESRKLG